MAAEKTDMLARMRAAARNQPATVRASSKPSQTINSSIDSETEGQDQSAQILQQMRAASEKYQEPQGFFRTFGQGAASLGDVVTGVVPAAVETVVYPFARAFGPSDKGYKGPLSFGQSPEQATRTAQEAASYFAQPFGKAAGVTETPGYKDEATRYFLEEYVAKNLDKGADWISRQTGAPVDDVKNVINQLTFVAGGPAAETAGAAARAVGRTVKREAGYLAGAVTPRKPPPPVPQPAPSAAADLQAAFEERQRQAAAPPAQPAPPAAPETQPGAPPPAAAPQAPAQRVQANAPVTELEYAENGLPLPVQMERAETVRRTLGPDASVDLAAIEGKGIERATNYAASKTDTELGGIIRNQLQNEKILLGKAANERITETGGTVGLDESTRTKRGSTILEPLNKLEEWYDKRIRQIYKDRDKAAAQIPVQTQKVLNILNDESMTDLNTDSIGLAKVARSRLIKLGMIDKDGNLLPTTAEKAERFRKFINERYSPQNSTLHRALKDAVDEDVMSTLGTDSPFYQDARNLVTQRKNTLDNPNGIRLILEESGPDGVNRKVPKEQIADKIANMDVEQASHIIETLRAMPDELKPEATKAINEIKAHFANKIAESLDKSPATLTKYLNDNREIMSRLFTADEMAKFRDLHDTAHILKIDTGYPGAAVQKINLEKRPITRVKEQLLQKGASAVAGTVTGAATSPIDLALGGALGSTAAITAHELIGRRIARGEEVELAKAQRELLEKQKRRFVKLSDLIQEGQ